jgi:hypothetical protein
MLQIEQVVLGIHGLRDTHGFTDIGCVCALKLAIFAVAHQMLVTFRFKVENVLAYLAEFHGSYIYNLFNYLNTGSKQLST